MLRDAAMSPLRKRLPNARHPFHRSVCGADRRPIPRVSGELDDMPGELWTISSLRLGFARPSPPCRALAPRHRNSVGGQPGEPKRAPSAMHSTPTLARKPRHFPLQEAMTISGVDACALVPPGSHTERRHSHGSVSEVLAHAHDRRHPAGLTKAAAMRALLSATKKDRRVELNATQAATK